MRRAHMTVMFAVLAMLVGDARSKPSTGSVRGTVTINAKGKAKSEKKGVVVYLEGVAGTPPVPKDHTVIRQREKQKVRRIYGILESSFKAAGAVTESAARKPRADAQKRRTSGAPDAKVLRESADKAEGSGYGRWQQLAGLTNGK